MPREHLASDLRVARFVSADQTERRELPKEKEGATSQQ